MGDTNNEESFEDQSSEAGDQPAGERPRITYDRKTFMSMQHMFEYGMDNLLEEMKKFFKKVEIKDEIPSNGNNANLADGNNASAPQSSGVTQTPFHYYAKQHGDCASSKWPQSQHPFSNHPWAALVHPFAPKALEPLVNSGAVVLPKNRIGAKMVPARRRWISTSNSSAQQHSADFGGKQSDSVAHCSRTFYRRRMVSENAIYQQGASVEVKSITTTAGSCGRIEGAVVNNGRPSSAAAETDNMSYKEGPEVISAKAESEQQSNDSPLDRAREAATATEKQPHNDAKGDKVEEQLNNFHLQQVADIRDATAQENVVQEVNDAQGVLLEADSSAKQATPRDRSVETQPDEGKQLAESSNYNSFQWYVLNTSNGQLRGPVDDTTLRSLIGCGLITPSCTYGISAEGPFYPAKGLLEDLFINHDAPSASDRSPMTKDKLKWLANFYGYDMANAKNVEARIQGFEESQLFAASYPVVAVAINEAYGLVERANDGGNGAIMSKRGPTQQLADEGKFRVQQKKKNNRRKK